jgi:hypothetical protein
MPCLFVVSLVGLVVWMFGCLDVWMFGCLDVWMFGCLDVWMFSSLVARVLACWHSCLLVRERHYANV